MNNKWNYQPPSQEQTEAAKALAKETGISPVLCKLLLERGISSAAEAKRFFRPQLNELHDPFLMKDMDIAVDRLNEAMGRKERILVYGDYDVDGTTAVALVYKFLQQFYSNIDYYIPDRYEEGYGVSVKGVDYAYETGVKLIIVLDCGIKAVNEIAYAKEKGIDFIICDHHVPDDVLPPAVAILNAKRPDATYPYEHLSGCGVGFKFMQAFAINNGIEFYQLTPLLDLVAVSVASDIVPIMGENRVLTYHGLKQLNSNPSIGLKAIIDREVALRFDGSKEMGVQGVNAKMKEWAKSVFMITAVSQNNLVDTTVVLVMNYRQIEDLVLATGFRPTRAQMFRIYANILTTTLISYCTSEVLSDLAGETTLTGAMANLKIPGVITESAIQGAVNALLTLRIGYVTKTFLMEGPDALAGRTRRREVSIKAFKDAFVAIPGVLAGTVGAMGKGVLGFFRPKKVEE